MPNHDEGNYCAVWNQIYKKHCWFSINLNILYYPLKCPFMSVLVYCPLLACLYWSNSPELCWTAQSTVRQTSNQPTQRKVLHRLRQRPPQRPGTSLSLSTKYFINFILHIKPLEFVWQRRPVVALVGPRPDRVPSRRKTCSDALRKNPNRGQEENDDGQRSLHSAWTQAHVYERNQICNRSFFFLFLGCFHALSPFHGEERLTQCWPGGFLPRNSWKVHIATEQLDLQRARSTSQRPWGRVLTVRGVDTWTRELLRYQIEQGGSGGLKCSSLEEIMIFFIAPIMSAFFPKLMLALKIYLKIKEQTILEC